MKKLLLSSLLICPVFFFSAHSQTLSIAYIGGAIVPNSTVQIIGDPTDEPIKIDIQVTNHAAIAQNVKVKKTIHPGDTLPGTTNTFCWGVCYPPFIYVSPQALTLEAGATNDEFDGDYSPLGVIGVSTIIYTFFIDENPSDSVAVTVEFKASPTGIGEKSDQVTFSNPYPNPANQQVSFNYALPEGMAGAKLSISNILGATVREIAIVETSGTLRIPAFDLGEGIYFYTLKAGNKNLVTNKMIIKR